MLTRVSVPGLDHLPRALLVDRDADTRRMYAEFLIRSACEVDEAEDGREGLAKALTRHPDVVVTETRLPGINGFELCRILREDELTREIALVVVTGDAFVADVERARKSGADIVLTKPCLPDQLAHEIQRILNESRELRARARSLSLKVQQRLAHSTELIDRMQANRMAKRVMLSHAHHRGDTTTPPARPPALLCPTCDQPLKYVNSHIGGVSERHQEQWDYFECTGGCGTFQYRQRTRKLRRVM